MNREEAVKLVKDKIQNRNLIKHCFAVEACMRALTERFDDDKEKWGLAGLLHDIDYEETKNNPQKHSLVGAEMLKKLGVNEEIIEAVKTHNEVHTIVPKTNMGKALLCVDPMTGLIIAATLVLPNKKIADLTAENVLNRFKEKGFARGANREIINKCENTGLKIKEFTAICLKAMQGISDDLGL